MNGYTVRTIEKPSREQIDLIVRPLKQYNELRVGQYRREEVAVYAYDQIGQLIGGMHGWLLFGWLHIENAWVDESMRHHGIGSRLLSACEQFAVEHGIHDARTNTGSFQAPDFYRKNGYEIFAQLDIIAPDGGAQVEYFLKKQLKPL